MIMGPPDSDVTVILTGQSNAGTGSDHSDALPSPMLQVWHAMARDTSGDTLTHLATGYGPEVGILQAARPTRCIKLVHYAVGGQPITSWKPGGTDYSQTCEDIQDAMGWTDPPVLVFVHGEADAQVEVQADAYGANLTSAIAGWRIRWGAGLEVVLVLLASDSGWPYASTVRAAQLAVAAADSLVTTVDSTGIPKHDTSHYTGAGQVTLGRLVAAAANLL
jgi:hypothetical protein